MAKYDELPVYKASYDLLLEIFQFTKNFNKEFKYCLFEWWHPKICSEILVFLHKLVTQGEVARWVKSRHVG